MKNLITFLSTCLFLSLMIHVQHNEYMFQLQKNDQISDRIIGIICNRLQEVEMSIVE